MDTKIKKMNGCIHKVSFCKRDMNVDCLVTGCSLVCSMYNRFITCILKQLLCALKVLDTYLECLLLYCCNLRNQQKTRARL